MSGSNGNGSVPSLPPPQPKSPPKYPDLYGRRRELVKVQVLEREIGFLEEELKSIEGLQLASRSCKETKKIRRSCRFWNWLCGDYAASRPRVFAAVVAHLVRRCLRCNPCNSCSNPCSGCGAPKCRCFSCLNSQCCNIPKCSCTDCCSCCCSVPNCPPCPTCSCTSCTCSCCPECLKLKNICSCCHKKLLLPCYFCY